MSIAGTNEYGSVMQQVSLWPTELKLALADELIQSCRVGTASGQMRGVSPDELWNMLDVIPDNGRPSDDEDTRLLEEALLEKYLK